MEDTGNQVVCTEICNIFPFRVFILALIMGTAWDNSWYSDRGSCNNKHNHIRIDYNKLSTSKSE